MSAPMAGRHAGGDAADAAPPATLARLRAALEMATGAPVQVRETHVSWVLLAGDRAFKLKKPVRLAFVDQSTPRRRRALCEEELRLNRATAPGVVLGVRALVPDGDALVPAPADAPEAEDWVVEMRRFDEARTLAGRLAAGTLRPQHVEAAGRAVAAFHAAAPPVAVADPAAAVRMLAGRNLDELAPLAARAGVGEPALAAARHFADAFAAARAGELAARAAGGLVVDGHGDLRAEHVLLEPGGVELLDRLEFDAGLRTVDVADDLAFLLMDLAALGADAAADQLLAAYRAAGGRPGDDALLAFFGAYRAQVRAKVALLRADVRAGRALLALGRRFAWRARGPLLLLVTGPPASGKSTLARALADESGLPVCSADAARKAALGLALDAPAPPEAYAPQRRADVYRELARRGAAAFGRSGAIIDATFGSAALQQAFFAALPAGPRAAVRVVECHADQAELARRAAARERAAAAGSDAGPQVALRLAATHAALPATAGPRLVLATDAPPAELACRVSCWLDDLLQAPAQAPDPQR